VELRKAVLAALDRELFVPEWLLEMVGVVPVIPPQWERVRVHQLAAQLLDEPLEDAPE